MNATALPVYRDRPAVLPSQGGRVFISVHDAAYLRERAAWKQRLADAHPDRTGLSGFAFRKLVKERDRWDAAEVAWYAQYGLTPPETSTRVAPTRLYERPLSKFATRNRVAAYLDTAPMATTREIAKALGLTVQVVGMARYRLRRFGPTGYVANADRLAALLSDGEPHTYAACHAALPPGTSTGTAGRAIQTLRAEGFDIITESRPTRGKAYRLVIPGTT